MDRDRRLRLIVGGFIVASLGLLALAIVLLSADSGIFTPQYRLVAGFRNVQGLLPGAPVWLAGKEVGRVDSISFGPAEEESPLRVVLRGVRVQARLYPGKITSAGHSVGSWLI